MFFAKHWSDSKPAYSDHPIDYEIKQVVEGIFDVVANETKTPDVRLINTLLYYVLYYLS